MTPFWIEISDGKRVAIVPRPRGNDWLEDELRALKAAGVDVLVSMLTPEEQSELGLTEEPALATAAGLKFLSYAINDRETPDSTAAFRTFIAKLRHELASGNTVATHCRASIGRASVVLVCLLCDEGLTPAAAFQALSAARGTHVPDTPEQIRWVERYAQT